MAYNPISGIVPQISKNSRGGAANGYYLKAYYPGTVTPLSMSIDQSASLVLAKCKLNSRGEPISNDSDETTVFIPYFNQDYKLALFQNSTDANNNDVSEAVWIVDDIQQAPNVNAANTALTIGDTATNVESWANNLDVDGYAEVRLLDTATLYDGQTINVTDTGIARQGVIRNLVAHGLTDNMGTIIVIDVDWWWDGGPADGVINQDWFYEGTDTVNVQAAFTASNNLTYYNKKGNTHTITTTITMPENIILDNQGVFTFTGDVNYWIDGEDQNYVLIKNWESTQTDDFSSRTLLNRQIRPYNGNYFEIERGTFDRASTAIHVLNGEDAIFRNVKITNSVGEAAQYGYGINCSAKRVIITGLDAEGIDILSARHMIYINGEFWETVSITACTFKNIVHNPIQITNTGTGNSCTAYVDDIKFDSCNLDPLTSNAGCLNVGSGGGTAEIFLTAGALRAKNCPAGIVGSEYSGLINVEIGHVIADKVPTAENTAVSLVYFRNAVSPHVSKITCKLFGTDWQSALYFRDCTTASFDEIDLGGSVGDQVVRASNSTVMMGIITNSVVPPLFNSASTITYKNIPAQKTFTASDVSPSVAGSNSFLTDTGTLTILDLDDGVAGQLITIKSKGAVTYDVTGTNLNGGTTGIATAAGDITMWECEDGTDWTLISYMDNTANNN